MATRVEVKRPALALSEPRERVSESRLSRAHVSPLTDSSNKAPELGPGALILPEEGSKPAQTFSPGGSTSNNMPSLGPKPRLTPKPFALEKAPIMRPIVAPKPAPKPRGVPGKPALTPSGPPKPSESRTAEPPKPAPLPKTRTLPETEALPRDGFTQIEPLRVTLYETVTIQRAQTIGAGQQERPSAETRRTENPRPEGSPRPAEWTAQAERRPAAFPGSSLSRAKSMGFLGKAAVDQDSEASEAVGSQVPDSQASEPRVRMRSKSRPVSAVFPSPGTDRSRADQDSEPPSQAEKPWLRSPRPLSMDLTARFEAIGLSLNRKSGSGLAPPEESKENMPAAPGKHSDTGSRGEEEPERRGFQKKEPTDAPGKKAEKAEEPRSELDEGWSTEKATWEGERETEGQEVTENRGIPEEKPPVPVPAAAPSPSPSLAAADSQVTKREEENRAPPSGGNIRRRISLLLESSSVGVSSSPGAESSPPATPPSASEVINVGIRQRIKELKVGMPEAKPEPQRRSYQPRPRSSDLTKRFPTEAVTRETLSLSPTVEKTVTEMEGTKMGPERENQDQYRKTEDPSPSRSEQTDSKFPEFSRKSMKSTRPVPENLPSSKPEVVNQVARKGSILGEKLPLGPQCESLPQASEQQQPAGKKPDSKARDGSYSSFQTVRASLFENYVVKHKVMEAHICSDNSNLKQETTGGRSGVPELDQGQSPDSVRWERERERERSGTSTSISSSSSSESFRRSLPYRDEDRRSSPSTAALRDEPSPLVTREVLPKCVVEAVRVDHVFDTIQAVSKKAVSESVPVALEDKAMTLRSRRPAAKDARDSESPSVQSQGVRQQPVPVNAPKGEPVPERSDKRELYRKLPAEETQSQGASRMAKSRIRTEESVTGQQAVPERVNVPKEEIVWGVADDGSLGSRGTRAKPDEGPAETKQPSGGAKYLRVGSLFKWRAEALQEKDEYFKKETPHAQRDSSPDAYNWSSSEKKPRRSEAESAEHPSTTETHSLSKGEARTFKQGQTLSTQGKSAVSEFEEFSRAKENEYPSEVPAGDHRRTAASSGNRGTSMRTREDRPANSGAEEVTAPKSLKTADQDVGLKQRGNTRVRDTPPKEKRKDSEPRATYFALTGQMPDYPLESLGSKTTQQQQPSEGVGIDVAFDDFSVKSYRRWGTQGQVLNLKRNPSLEAAYGKLEVKDLGIEDAPKSYKRTAAGSRSDEAGEETGNKSHMRPKVLNVDAMLYESRRDSPESEKPACPDPQSYQPPRGSREMEVDRVAKGNAPTFRAEEGYRMEVLDIDALTAEYKGMSPKVTDPWQKRLEEDCYPLARTSRGSSQPSTNLDSPSGARTYAAYQPSDLPKPEPQKPTGFVDSYSREERRAKPDYIYPETTRHSPLERNSSLEDVYATSRSSEADWRQGYRKDAPKPSWVQHSESVRDSDHGAGREKRVGYAVDEALDSRLKQRVKEPREEDLWLPSAKPVPSQSARLENDWYIPRVSVSDERHGQESRSYLPRETAASARAPYEADARRQSRKKEQELEPHYPEPRKQGYPPAQDSPVAPAEPSRGRQSFPQESGLKRSKSMHRPRALAWGEKKDSSRERSKSSSRKSFGAVDTLDGASLTRMRAHSMNRERTSERGADQLKQCVTKPSSDSKDTDTLVHEADSQYGTWDTGLRTDDSLTPATPTGSSSPSASLRRRTPDRDSALSLSSSTPGELAETAFPDQPTSFLDSSALKTRVQLSKKRIKRTLPSRSVRLSGVPAGGDRLSVLLENTRADDWMFKDSTEEKPVRQAEEEDSDEEERPRRSDRSPALQPQRVPLFPGMDPSALKAQLRKRTDSDSPAEGSPSSQLPKSPFSQGTAGCRVLPPAGGKENGSEEMSPQWMKELKSKKRLSQYESNP